MTYDYEVQISREGSDEVVATAVFTNESEMRSYAEGIRQSGFRTKVYRKIKDGITQPVNL